MLDFSPVQILIVLAIALIVFGPKRLPEMGRSIGRGIREFKSSIDFDAPASPSTPTAPDAPVDAASIAPPPPAPSADDKVLEGLVVPGDQQPGR